MTGAPTARAVALALLEQVLRRRRTLEDALAGTPDIDALSGRDRAFARLLVTTVLRRCGQIDDLIGRCLERPLAAGAWRAKDILRLGAAQLLFLHTAHHAAVDTAVDLARHRGAHAHLRLINAVLRRLARDGCGWRDGQDSARLNTPDWLWRSWIEAYGEATARAIAEVHSSEPPLDITAKGDERACAALLDAELLPTGSLRRPAGGLISELPGFADGAWWVQDAAAAMPARLLGDVAGQQVVELCAAPGGKTAQLAAAGARVTALDRSEARLRKTRDNLDRLGLEADFVTADACEWRPDPPVEKVLLDAPCSATGTIRRHPDVVHLKSPADVPRLADLQDRLLAAAVAMLAPGGVLVYATCSLQPEEGPRRIAAVLARNPRLVRIPIAADEVGGDGAVITDDGDLRTLPCHFAALGGLDGFYAARLKRLGEAGS
ncbi:MAG: transcription antitermination factor NusB [Alphaproteobacteria bacterium]|jgi:16S rRNA (cytosine967-C5)-methyltransferase|nr:transcription antitermination factor NusB [Alphaproteobacteria bacterium]MDP6515093.1 transcription antitermination factor NusB [Alphaproteobacteria bacterium]